MTDITTTLNSVYRYALALTHDEHLAEDLVQDAWVKVIKAGGDRNVGYLRTTVKNLYIDRYRQKKLTLVADADMLPQSESDETENSLPVDISKSQLNAALGKIRPDEREVLFLMCVEDFSAQEVADTLEKPRGTILSLLHRAKLKLRKTLVLTDFRNGTRGVQ